MALKGDSCNTGSSASAAETTQLQRLVRSCLPRANMGSRAAGIGEVTAEMTPDSTTWALFVAAVSSTGLLRLSSSERQEVMV